MPIDRLLFGRTAINEYYLAMNIKGKKTRADFDRLAAALSTLGFADTSEFFDYNLTMDLQEADRCFRFRTLADDNAPAICDNCTGRCDAMCITSCNGGSDVGRPWIDGYIKHTPDSAIVAEQDEEAVRQGKTLDFHIVPIIMILCHDISEAQGSLSPGFCTGKAVQIIEPRFDWLWGMESYRQYGTIINNNMAKAGVQS